MATIIPIDLSTPNSGLGDPLRTGGDYINDNFISLNTDKLETGGYLGNGQDLLDLININIVNIGNSASLLVGNTFTGIQSMTNLVAGTVTSQTFISTDPYEIDGSVGLTKTVTAGFFTDLVFEGGILVNVVV